MKKKILSALMIGAMVFTTGCNTAETNTETKTETTANTELGSDTQATISGTYTDKTGVFGSWKFGEDGSLEMTTASTYELNSTNDGILLTIYELESKDSYTQYLVNQSGKGYELDNYVDTQEIQGLECILSQKGGADGLTGTESFDGTYEDETNQVEYAFAADGTLSQTLKETYEISEDTLTLTGTTGSTDYTYALSNDGNEVIVYGENNLEIVLEK